MCNDIIMIKTDVPYKRLPKTEGLQEEITGIIGSALKWDKFSMIKIQKCEYKTIWEMTLHSSSQLFTKKMDPQIKWVTWSPVLSLVLFSVCHINNLSDGRKYMFVKYVEKA